MAGNARRLSALAVAVVAAAIVLVVALAFAAGADAALIFYVAPIVLLGVVAIGVAIKTRAGSVGPEECPRCGGLTSPNAPYCKHCGARLDV